MNYLASGYNVFKDSEHSKSEEMPKACSRKEKKLDKFDFIKVKNLFSTKHNAQQIKCKLQTARKSLQKMSNEELIHKIYKELLE